MTNQPGWHGVENLAQQETARGGNAHRHLFIVGGSPGRQRFEAGAFNVDALGIAGVDSAYDLVDETPVSLQVLEVSRPAHDQRVPNGALQVAMGAFDRAVLMGYTFGIPRGRHAIMSAQRVNAVGEVGLSRLLQILERSREAVGPVILRNAAKRPEGILQPFGQRHIALATEHNMGMLEAGIGQPKVIQSVIQRLCGDRHAKLTHVGEVRQPHLARHVDLPKDNFLFGAVFGPPRAYPPLQRAPNARAQIGVSAQEFFEDGDRPQTGGGLKQRNHLGVEDIRQRVWPPPASRVLPLRRQDRVGL